MTISLGLCILGLWLICEVLKMDSSLTILKTRVIKAHGRKVKSWNRLATNPYQKNFENQYLADCYNFSIEVYELVSAYRLAKLRGVKCS